VTETVEGQIGKITPAGVVTVFPTLVTTSRFYSITAGSDGALWFTEAGNVSKIGRMTTAGVLTEYATPSPAGFFNNEGSITSGPDGSLWFTEPSANKIGRLDPTRLTGCDATPTNCMTEFAIPTAGSGPAGITAGPDGALWFAEKTANKVGRITTAGVVTNEFSITTASAGANDITAGPDGNLWFTEHLQNAVVRLTPAGVFTFFTIPTAAANPSGITLGPDGALWFAENGVSQIGRIDTIGNIVEFGGLTGRPDRITAGPDGNLWFTEPLPADSKIGRITPANGAVSEFQVTLQSQPGDIVTGPDGNLWFTEFNTEFLSQITPAGVVTDVQKARGGPFGIGRAPDGALWVALMSGNKLGRFSLR